MQSFQGKSENQGSKRRMTYSMRAGGGLKRKKWFKEMFLKCLKPTPPFLCSQRTWNIRLYACLFEWLFHPMLFCADPRSHELMSMWSLLNLWPIWFNLWSLNHEANFNSLETWRSHSLIQYFHRTSSMPAPINGTTDSSAKKTKREAHSRGVHIEWEKTDENQNE